MARQVTNDRGDMERVRYMYVGQVFKSYRDLCRFLDADILGGNSKTYQLEYFAKYFRWQRDKHRWIIQEIYEQPLDIPFFKKEEDYEWSSITVITSEREKAIRILKQHGIHVLSDNM